MSEHLGWPDAIAAAVLLPCVLWFAYARFQRRKALFDNFIASMELERKRKVKALETRK